MHNVATRKIAGQPLTQPRLRVGFDTSGLDPSFKSHAHRGIGRYVAHLSRYFENNAHPEIAIGSFNHRSVSRGSSLAKGLDQICDLLPFGKMTVRQQLLYPFNLNGPATREFDILHFPAHMDAPAWGNRRTIVTVLDLIPLIFSDLYAADKPSWRFNLARWLELRAITHASLIITISQAGARDVHRLLGVPWERIVVTPLGVDERFFATNIEGAMDEASLRSRYAIPRGRDVVLYVGGIDPRKNMKGLLTSFSLTRDRYRSVGRDGPVLLVAGNIQGDREYPKFQALREELGLQSDVVTPGYVPDQDLLKLYAISKLLFFPSLYEGFGLTVLEAMASGLPVVSSNTSSLPEVVGDAGVLVPPQDHFACADALHALLENPERRAELSEKGRKRAEQFSWEKTGIATAQAYERVIV